MMRVVAAGPAWLSYAFPFLFVGAWIGIGWMNALLGGWRRLAQGYRGRLADPCVRERCSSAALSRVSSMSYGNALTVAAGAAGVGLSAHWSFALGNPPLVIPWGALVECRSWQVLGLFDRFSFAVADTGVRVTIGGKAARRLEREVTRHDPERPVLAGAPSWW